MAKINHISKADRKYQAYKFGLFAEFITIIYLKLYGYKILAKRYKTKVGEIDIIAARNKKLAIIEVKARRDKDISLEQILRVKQINRIMKATNYFIMINPKYQNFDVRFDLMVIRPWTLPEHLQNIIVPN